MAIIKRPEDDQTQGGTMNVLGPESTQSGNMQSEAQNQGVNISGQSSATAGSPQGQQASNQPKKGVGSGQAPMYQKYVQANKGQAGRMASAAAQNFGQQAGSVAQAIQQKRDKFSEQVAANRAGIEQAKQFGQQAVRSATQAEDMQDLQRQQQDLQARRASLGQIQEGGYQQQIQQQQQQVQQMEAERARQEQLQQQMRDYEQQIGTLSNQQADLLGVEDYQSGGRRSRTWYRTDFGGSSRNRDEAIQQGQQAAQLLAEQGQSAIAQGYTPTAEQQEAMDYLAQRNDLGRQIAEARAAQGELGFDANFLNQYQAQRAEQMADLSELQNLQKAYERGGQLDTELSELQARMENAPETLTDEDVDRFRRLAEGRERYDQLAFNVAQQQRETEDIAGLARDVERGEARRRILRDALAGGSEYTRGESALDEAIIQSDPEARERLVQEVQQTGRGLEEQLRGARRSSLQEMGELQRDNRQLIETLNTQVDEGTQAIKSELDRRVETGEGTYLDALRNAVAEGTVSAEQAEQLGLSGGSLYGADLQGRLEDLSGLATRESVASRSELARAQALARLAGQSQQDIFASPDTVGQMSEAERGRLLEARGDVEAARRAYQSDLGAKQAAYNAALRGASREGDRSIQSYISGNTQQMLAEAQKRIAQKGLEGLSRGDLNAINERRMYQGSGHAAWGVGDTDKALAQLQAEQALREQGREGGLLVEGTDIAQQAASQRQADLSRAARMQALDLLTGGRVLGRTREYGDLVSNLERIRKGNV